MQWVRLLGDLVGKGPVDPGALSAEINVVPPAPEIAPQPFGGFKHTAIGSGYIRVFVDDIEVSKHTMQHKAAESAESYKLRSPLSSVTYKPEFEIKVEIV